MYRGGRRGQPGEPPFLEGLPSFGPAGGPNLFKNSTTGETFTNKHGHNPYNPEQYHSRPTLPPTKYEIRGKNVIMYVYNAIGSTIVTVVPLDKLSSFTLYKNRISFNNWPNPATHVQYGYVNDDAMLPSPEGFRQSFYQALEISPISMTFPGFPNQPSRSILNNNNSNGNLLNIGAQRRANLGNILGGAGAGGDAGGGAGAGAGAGENNVMPALQEEGGNHEESIYSLLGQPSGGGGSSRHRKTRKRKNRCNRTRKN